jgi:hypothetical protein
MSNATPNPAKKTAITVESLALAGAGIVAMGAIVGSSASLYRIGAHAGLAAPWSLPIALDLTAMVAALAVRANRSDRLAWATLLGATLVSAVLQIVEATGGIAERATHAIVPLGALIAFELALHMAPKPKRRTTRRPATKGKATPRKRPAPAAVRSAA